MRPPREDTVPWYRQFWPWFLISLPLSVVIAAIVTIVIAVKTDDGLVSDDYYKKGLAIHKDADSAAKARALGIAGQLTYDADTGALKLLFDSALQDADSTLQLEVTHPTRRDRDQVVSLTRLGDTSYAGRVQPLEDANWKLALRPPDSSWRIEGRLTVPAAPSTRLD